MSAEFTKGPWHWAKARTQMHLQDSTRSCFAGISMPLPEKMRHAECREQYARDAAAVEATPDLYAALRALYRAAPSTEDMNILIAMCAGNSERAEAAKKKYEGLSAALDMAEAALRKAEGKESGGSR